MEKASQIRATAGAPGFDAAESRARLQRVLDGSNDGFWEWDVPSGEAWVSARWCEILGHDPREGWIHFDDAVAMVHPDDLPRLLTITGSIIADNRHGDRYDFEYRCRRPDGRIVWVEARAIVTSRGPDGRALQISGGITDITARKQAEEKLRRFELLAGEARDIILFLRREDGHILEANAAAAAAYGYSRDELLALSIVDLRGENTRASVAREMEEADRRTSLFETVHRRKDGTTFPVEVSSRGATVGGSRTLISVIRDISGRKRAERAIREAAQFPAQNPAPVMRFHADGRLLFANPASAPILREWECQPGESGPEWLRARLQSAMSGPDGQRFEAHVAGREFSFLLAPIRAESYVNLYGHDVTEHNRDQRSLSRAKARDELLAHIVARLLESEEPQRIIGELAAPVMELLGCDVFVNYLVDDREGRLHLNASAGVSGESAKTIEWLNLGDSVCGSVAHDGSAIVPQGLAGVRAYACHPMIAAGKLIGTLAFGSHTRDGFPNEELALMQTVTHQIALALERMKSRNLLRESEARYRAVARSIPGGAVWVVDRDLCLRVVEGSLLEQFGVPAAAIEGRTVREAFPGTRNALVEERFRRALNGSAGSYETEWGPLTLWAQYVPLTGDSGHVDGAMALTLDITQRKRMEERLRQSQKMESIAVLAGGIAHDFNNLLVGIVGNASLALDILPPSSPAVPVLNDVVTAGEQAARLTREMLAYSGRGRFVVERTDLCEATRSTVNLVRSSIPAHVTLHLDLARELLAVEADVAQLQQVIMNLVINAAEAIGASPGLITVRLRPATITAADLVREWDNSELAPGDYVVLEVSDTGCGMDAATRARVFDPFFTTKFTGRGLGLAAVLGIMRGHRGAIRVESTPGRGSSFSVAFPAAPPARDLTPETESQPDTAPAGKHVLVVDDEELVLRTARAALERHGLGVLTAASAAAALELVRNGAAIDLVLLDLSMPGMTGHEALAQIREMRPDVPVLISSGYSESECIELFRHDRISGVVQKPYTARRLCQAVIGALAGE